jgi:hypothetical protein
LTFRQSFEYKDLKLRIPKGLRPLEERSNNQHKMKKSAKKKRHPNIKKAIAHIEKLQKGQRDMALSLQQTKDMLARTPFHPAP